MTTRKYHVLLEHVSDGIIGVCRDGLINFCNPVAQRRIGGDVSLVGQPFPSLFAPGDPNHGVSWQFSFFPDLMIRQEKMFNTGGKLVGSNGVFFDACYSFVPLPTKFQKTDAGLLIFNEITQLRHDDSRPSRLTCYNNLAELPNEVALRETLEQIQARRRASKKLLDELLGRLARNNGAKPESSSI